MSKLPSVETLKRSVSRGLETMLVTALAGVVVVPFNVNKFEDFKAYGFAILFAFCVGLISGLVKFIKGYVLAI